MVMPALMRRSGGAKMVGPVLFDQLFDNVISSFHFNGANDSRVFIDEVKERAWTLNYTLPNYPRISTTNPKFGNASARFHLDGYLSHPYDPDFEGFDLGHKFTIEFWLNPTTMGYSTSSGLVQLTNAAGSTTRLLIERDSGNTFYLYFAVQDSLPGIYWSGDSVFTAGWTHVACVCEGTGTPSGLKIYLNGVPSPGTQFDMNRVAPSGNISLVGAATGTSSSVNFLADVYLDDLRITKGEARYKAAFTAPSSQFLDGDPGVDRYFDSVSSLLHFNEAAGTGPSGFVDQSGKGWGGGGAIVASPAKFGAGALRLNGTDVWTANVAAFKPGLEPFTLEMWFRPDAISIDSQNLLSSRDGGQGHSLRVESDGRIVYFWGGVAFAIATTTSVTANTWHHVAVTRDSSGNCRIFLDGVLEDSTIYTGDMAGSSATTIYLGVWMDAGTPRERFSGYIDEFRYTTGVSRYNGSFALPDAQYADQGPSDAYWHLTGFLQHFDGVNGTTVNGLIDECGTPLVLQEGTLNLSSTQRRFGKTSMYCPGSAKATTPSRADWQDLSDVNQFTVEYWWYPTTATGVNIALSCRGFDNAGWDLYPEDLTVVFQGQSSYLQTPGNPLVLNSWNHIAAVREAADVYKVYVNGILRITGNVSIARGINPLGFGGRAVSPAYFATGYMDEVRITKGAARYLADFPIPNRPFPINKKDAFWTNVSMLTHFDGADGSTTLVDNKTPARVFNAVGGVALSTASPLMGSASFQHSYDAGSGKGWTTVGDTAFNLGSEDFTIEVMVSIPSYSGNYQSLLAGDDAAGTRGWYLLVDNTAGGDRLKFGWSVGGSTQELVGDRLAPGARYCIAVVRRGSGLYLYVDGVRVNSATITGAINDAGAFGIGTMLSGGGAVAATSSDFKFDEARITKGVARLVARQKYPWPNA